MMDDDADGEGAAEILERLEASRIGPTQREALRMVIGGSGFSEAAEAVGLRSTGKLRQHAKRLGIKPPARRPFVSWAASKVEREALAELEGDGVTDAVTAPRSAESEALVGQWRQAGSRSLRELIRRLDTAPEKIRTADLTAAAGAATEKVRAWEQWDRAERGDAVKDSQLAELLERLTTGGNTVTVGITVERDPRGETGRVIDVARVRGPSETGDL